MQETIIVNMTGDVAENHEIPAYLGSKSIYGISRSLLIITNLATEGRVRKKDYDLNKFSINLQTPRAGSFELVYHVVFHPVTLTLAGGVAASMIWDALKYCGKRLSGHSPPIPQSTEKLLEKAKSTEDRLLDALEPSVREVHQVINNGVINMNFNNGKDEDKLKFDLESKKYVWDNVIDRNLRTKLFSVSKFDVTSAAGAAFDFEEKRPISFQLDAGIDYLSIQSVMKSQRMYAAAKFNNELINSAVAFKYTSINTIDNRVKKMFVAKVRDELTQI